jgi:hypothetical protein
MGVVMVRCPETGREISTGMRMDRSSFGRMPVFFGRTLCPICCVKHELGLRKYAIGVNETCGRDRGASQCCALSQTAGDRNG